MIEKSHYLWAEMKQKKSKHHLSPILVMLYSIKIIRSLCLKIVLKLEGGEFFSQTLREILFEYHQVKIGLYTYGSCMKPGVLPKGTIIGSYCSIADGLKVFRRNHPLNSLSQHPFFYNKNIGLLNNDRIEAIVDNPLIIGSDVWIGDSVTILPTCKVIGNGSVIGACSVVTKNVEPYSIVAGNPAKFIKQRYTREIESLIETSQWWNLLLADLLKADNLLFDGLNNEDLSEFANRNITF